MRPRHPRARALVLVLLALLLVPACGDDGVESDDGSGGGASTTADDPGGVVPTRAPEVSGRITLVHGDIGGAVRLVDASDPYYEGMGLLRATAGGTVLLVDEGGAGVDVDDLVEGMQVDVWVGSACAESYPVQCDIEALRVDTAS